MASKIGEQPIVMISLEIYTCYIHIEMRCLMMMMMILIMRDS